MTKLKMSSVKKMKKYLKISIICILLAALAEALVLFFGSGSNERILPKAVLINNTKINLEIAETQYEIIKGLSGRDSLESDKGLLFIFPRSEYYTFWMKDMKFPIDIIWINNDAIVDIFKNVPNEPGVELMKLKKYQPKEKANRVLEVNAGFTDKNGIKTGDRIKYLY